MVHRRTHGFSAPRNRVQLLSWGVFVTLVSCFYTLFLPSIADWSGRLSAGVIYAVFAIATIVACYHATGTDPADPCIYVAEDAGVTSEAVLYCYRCQRHVREGSKHCTICHKCVDIFDHHCVWLNNCVGRPNIVPFYSLLLSAGCVLSTQLAVGITAFVAFSTNPTSYGDTIASFYPSVLPAGIIAGVIVTSLVVLLALGLVVQLVTFHSFLLFHHLTTYDFIMQRSAVNAGRAALTAARGGAPAPDGASAPSPTMTPEEAAEAARYHGKGSSLSLWMRQRKDRAAAAAAAAAASAAAAAAVAAAAATMPPAVGATPTNAVAVRPISAVTARGSSVGDATAAAASSPQRARGAPAPVDETCTWGIGGIAAWALPCSPAPAHYYSSSGRRTVGSAGGGGSTSSPLASPSSTRHPVPTLLAVAEGGTPGARGALKGSDMYAEASFFDAPKGTPALAYADSAAATASVAAAAAAALPLAPLSAQPVTAVRAPVVSGSSGATAAGAAADAEEEDEDAAARAPSAAPATIHTSPPRR